MKSMEEREREELPEEEREAPPQAERTGLWRVLLNSLLIAVPLLALLAWLILG